MRFTGYRYEPFTCKVYVSDNDGKNLKNLPKFLNEVNHSPTGYEWGYGGSGPAQLAYAILRAVFGKTIALILHQRFKWDVVAKFPKAGFVLNENQVKEWYNSLDKED